MRALSVGLSVLILAVAGCVDEDAGRDRDGDGFRTAELGGDDCDDANPNVNPAASEACGNGIDDNCDGVVDDAGVGQVDWYVDGDGDGFPSDVVFQSCSPPDGSFADLTRGVDCDDNNNTINPGADEVYYDGVDQDCAGGDDDDADLDGHAAVAQGGDDCDDTNGSVNPSAVEVCNNGVDDDCDGGPGPCTLGDVVVLEEDSEIVLPYALVTEEWADLTGDGVDDFITVSAQDEASNDYRIRIYDGATFGSGSSPLTTLLTPVGTAVWNLNVAGDYNNDGIVDLVIWTADDIYVYDSPSLPGVRSVSSSSHRLNYEPTDAGVAFRFGHVSSHTNQPNGAADALSVFGISQENPVSGRTWLAELDGAAINLAGQQAAGGAIVIAGPALTYGDSTASASLVINPESLLVESVRRYQQLLFDPPVLTAGSSYSISPGLFPRVRVQRMVWDGEVSDVYTPLLWTGDVEFASRGVRVSVDSSNAISVFSLPNLYDVGPSDDGFYNLGGFYCDVDGDGQLDWVVNEGRGTIAEPTSYGVFTYLDVGGDPMVRPGPDIEFVTNGPSNLAAFGCHPRSDWIAVVSLDDSETHLVRRIGM